MSRMSKAPDVRRQELIEIGFTLYMKNGRAALSIKDIVDAAGVATGLFYYYFKSKEAFIDEALEYFILKNMAAMETILGCRGATALEKMQQGLQAFWQYAGQAAPYRSESSFQTEQHHALTAKLLEQMQPLVLQLIEEGVEQGVFYTSAPPLTAGFILYGLCSVLNTPVEIEPCAQKELNRLVFTALGIRPEEEKGEADDDN